MESNSDFVIRRPVMKTKLTIAIAAAITMAFCMNSAVLAKSRLPYPCNDRAANLQAMQWFAQQQMSQGRPNPYAGVNPYNANALYGNPYLNNNNSYANPYLYNNYGSSNPYYGYNPPAFGYW